MGNPRQLQVPHRHPAAQNGRTAGHTELLAPGGTGKRMNVQRQITGLLTGAAPTAGTLLATADPAGAYYDGNDRSDYIGSAHAVA
ncbi:hypothetical protein GCM10022384_03530 [Streptomyces marokkonensis]|uniref:Uncharacterized protein n=1 Tax=Streptomyces marokkonensis TaxID=324855 RepID=A0ABP7NSL8_9ACTN